MRDEEEALLLHKANDDPIGGLLLKKPKSMRDILPKSYLKSSQLPRKVPRKIKGKFRKIGAADHQGATGRVSVYCPYAALDLARLLTDKFEVQMPSDLQSNRTVLKGDPVTERRLTVKSSYGSMDDVAGGVEVGDPNWIASVFFDVVHLQLKEVRYDTDESSVLDTAPYPNSQRREVFLFGFGCVVMWNWHEKEELIFLASLKEFGSSPFSIAICEVAADDIDYFCGSSFQIRNDTVQLSSGDEAERLAVSYAFAQSSVLSIYEARLDDTIERNEHIPLALAKYGKIDMSQGEISREIGRLFIERNSINLESDIIGTPDYFWENDEWEPVYKKVVRYMEHEDRLGILNKRLDCVHELLDVLASTVESNQANRLEWIIIWLIVVEVVVDVFWNVLIKDILGYFQH